MDRKKILLVDDSSTVLLMEKMILSKSEYDAYKSYLFGNALPLKATVDGIHGPEVTFLGKSIPIATGVLPAVAAVIGGRYGARKAGARLADSGELKAAANLRNEWTDLKRHDVPSKFLLFPESGHYLVHRPADLLALYETVLAFLDHRPLRLRIAKEARGKRMLNLFCYTGAASVQ